MEMKKPGCHPVFRVVEGVRSAFASCLAHQVTRSNQRRSNGTGAHEPFSQMNALIGVTGMRQGAACRSQEKGGGQKLGHDVLHRKVRPPQVGAADLQFQ